MKVSTKEGMSTDMTTRIAVHDVDDVAHWLRSPKREEFFGAHGLTVRTFVSPDGGRRAGVVMENVPRNAEAAEAMKHHRAHPDSIEICVASQAADR